MPLFACSCFDQDLKGLELVEAQLATFRAEMERDSSIQREKVQRLVRTAASKAEELVDRELQLSSTSLTTYMFRGKGDKVALFRELSPALLLSRALLRLPARGSSALRPFGVGGRV